MVAVGVVGRDDVADHLRRLLVDIGATVDGLIATNRPTTCKMRLVGSAQHRHPQQMIRLDFEQTHPIDVATEQKLIDTAVAAIESVDLICIEDYDKGVVTPAVCGAIIAAARRQNKAVLIDPARIPDYRKYAGATCLKLNRPEAARATGLPVEMAEQFPPAAAKLLETLSLEAVVMTLDKQGAFVASRHPAEQRLLGTPAATGVRRDRRR